MAGVPAEKHGFVVAWSVHASNGPRSSTERILKPVTAIYDITAVVYYMYKCSETAGNISNRLYQVTGSASCFANQKPSQCPQDKVAKVQKYRTVCVASISNQTTQNTDMPCLIAGGLVVLSCVRSCLVKMHFV